MADLRIAPVALAQVDLRTADPSRSPIALPGANRWLADGDREAIWLGPDEWLVVGPPGTAAAIAADLGAAYAGTHASIVDVSANRVAYDLAGADVRDVLALGCTIDVHPTRWREGDCAQTLFGRGGGGVAGGADRNTKPPLPP
ncbi:MAG: sarcosine oxidase subunit gamma, partial [Actinomycetota bacterium]